MGDCGRMTWAPVELAMKIAAPPNRGRTPACTRSQRPKRVRMEVGLENAATTLALTQTGLLMEVIVQLKGPADGAIGGRAPAALPLLRAMLRPCFEHPASWRFGNTAEGAITGLLEDASQL
jgi:hypothetical protein